MSLYITQQSQFTVFTSSSDEDLKKVLENQTKLKLYPSVQTQSCQLFGTTAIDECKFTLSFYGEPQHGWIPHFENFFSLDPPSTYIGVQLATEHRERTVFSIQVTEVDYSYISFALLCLGFFLFSFSDILSYSPTVYMFCWCVGGTAVGVVAILVFILYIGSRLLNKENMGTVNMLLFTSLGWTSMYLANLIPSYADILRNGFVK